MKLEKEIIDALVELSSTLLAVVAGGIITYKLNLKCQSRVIKKQIEVEELKRLLGFIYDYKDSLLALKINFQFYYNNKSKTEFIKQRLTENNRNFVILEKELYLNEIMYKKYGVTVSDIKNSSIIISDCITYKIAFFDEKVEDYEYYIREKPISTRIEDQINKLDEYIKILQKEYIKGL